MSSEEKGNVERISGPDDVLTIQMQSVDADDVSLRYAHYGVLVPAFVERALA